MMLGMEYNSASSKPLAAGHVMLCNTLQRNMPQQACAIQIGLPNLLPECHAANEYTAPQKMCLETACQRADKDHTALIGLPLV
jgi:hypothetical protein